MSISYQFPKPFLLQTYAASSNFPGNQCKEKTTFLGKLEKLLHQKIFLKESLATIQEIAVVIKNEATDILQQENVYRGKRVKIKKEQLVPARIYQWRKDNLEVMFKGDGLDQGSTTNEIMNTHSRYLA